MLRDVVIRVCHEDRAIGILIITVRKMVVGLPYTSAVGVYKPP